MCQHLVPSMPFSLAFPFRGLGSSLPKAVSLFGSENIKSKHQGIAVAMSSRKKTLDEGVARKGIPRTSPNLKNTFVVYLPSDVSPTHSYIHTTTICWFLTMCHILFWSPVYTREKALAVPIDRRKPGQPKNKNYTCQVEEMSPSVKCLLCKHKEMRSNPQNHVEEKNARLGGTSYSHNT